ncbi:DUF349 domain-containing protein [Thalassotalea sediminis]|uniref:DUF349 domain-containing protein n=1 Tax=Thalassotalea sediminis TaxID=1759089 RepID=UPI0025743BBC|nr:DUF349 domain-containing protein [Thalassotalea sediminis]
MIFDRFFKENWQHKDANIRIKAIANDLSVEDQKQRSILQSLVTQDASELVRRAALLKLNDLEIYIAAAHSNDQNKIRKFASEQLEQQLINNSSFSLTTAEKQNLINDERLTKGLLEQWLKHEVEPALVLSLFNRIDKPQLLLNTFKKHPHRDVQRGLLTDSLSKEQLEKLSKFACNDEIEQHIQTLINTINEQLEKPIKVEKAAQLLLAKYLALKEEKSYQGYLDKQQQYVEQWRKQLESFSCLSSQQKDTLLAKYQDITEQVERAQAANAEAYQQQKIQAQLAEERKAQQRNIEEQISKLEQQLHHLILNESTEHTEALTTEIKNIEALLLQTNLKKNVQDTLLKSVSRIKSTLPLIPEIIDANAQATQIVTSFAQKSLPETLAQHDDLAPQFKVWQEKWQQCEKIANHYIPASIKEAYVEINNRWQQSMAPFKKQRANDFKDTQRKLNDTKRLITDGKYNTAFGVFKGAKQTFEQLLPEQQARLVKLYDSIEQQLDELNDWEHYVSTPKKQALLCKMEQLAEKPLDNPKSQADKVKEYRQQWNRLGHAEDELESDLNNQFNIFCEKAFAPCRQYFAEQEALRAENYNLRIELVEQAKRLVEESDDNQPIESHIASSLRKLEQKWRQACEVERDKYRPLAQTFKNTLAPLKKQLGVQYEENGAAKRSIIEKANLLLASEDSVHAAKEAIALQEAWKKIGFCGNAMENKLWQRFRTINDEIFANRAEVTAKKEQQLQEQSAQFEQQINTILNELNTDDLVAVKQSINQLNALRQQIEVQKDLPKTIVAKIDKQLSSLQANIIKINNVQRQQQWENLFELLTELAKGAEFSEDKMFALPKRWQKQVAACVSSKTRNALARVEKTIAIEILAELPSPDTDAEQRLAIQVALMQTQMTTKASLNIEQVFNEWLEQGNLAIEDCALLARIKSAFVA